MPKQLGIEKQSIAFFGSKSKALRFGGACPKERGVGAASHFSGGSGQGGGPWRGHWPPTALQLWATRHTSLSLFLPEAARSCSRHAHERDGQRRDGAPCWPRIPHYFVHFARVIPYPQKAKLCVSKYLRRGTPRALLAPESSEHGGNREADKMSAVYLVFERGTGRILGRGTWLEVQVARMDAARAGVAADVRRDNVTHAE